MAESTFTLTQCSHCDSVCANQDALDYHIEDNHPEISD